MWRSPPTKVGARLLRMVLSSVATGRGLQGSAGKALMQTLIQEELTGARGTSGDVADATSQTAVAQTAVPRVADVRAGGPIVPGCYSGNLVNNDGKVIAQYDVTLFANGEYVIEHGQNGTDSIGRFRYTPENGKPRVAANRQRGDVGAVKAVRTPPRGLMRQRSFVCRRAKWCGLDAPARPSRARSKVRRRIRFPAALACGTILVSRLQLPDVYGCLDAQLAAREEEALRAYRRCGPERWQI